MVFAVSFTVLPTSIFLQNPLKQRHAQHHLLVPNPSLKKRLPASLVSRSALQKSAINVMETIRLLRNRSYSGPMKNNIFPLMLADQIQSLHHPDKLFLIGGNVVPLEKQSRPGQRHTTSRNRLGDQGSSFYGTGHRPQPELSTLYRFQ